MSVYFDLARFAAVPTALATGVLVLVSRRTRLMSFLLGLVLAFAVAYFAEPGPCNPSILYSALGICVSVGAVVAEAFALVVRTQQHGKRMSRRAG